MTNVEKKTTLETFYNMISPDIDNFIDYLPMMIATNENEKRILKLAWDMVKSIREDVQNSENMSDLNEIFDVPAILRDFPVIMEYMQNQSVRVRDVQRQIEEEFRVYEE